KRRRGESAALCGRFFHDRVDWEIAPLTDYWKTIALGPSFDEEGALKIGSESSCTTVYTPVPRRFLPCLACAHYVFQQSGNSSCAYYVPFSFVAHFALRPAVAGMARPAASRYARCVARTVGVCTCSAGGLLLAACRLGRRNAGCHSAGQGITRALSRAAPADYQFYRHRPGTG